jgi:cyanophycinase
MANNGLLAICTGVLVALSCTNPTPTNDANSVRENGEENSASIGSLFIIGGGARTPGLLRSMVRAAELVADDYIVVLPMASSQPDTSYYYFSKGLDSLVSCPIFKFNLSLADVLKQEKLDSLANAKLIFVTGGDQNRFMRVVDDNPIGEAIWRAYQNGAMIAGTSAGAAIMSEVMITGDQVYTEKYQSTYNKIWRDNGIYAEGMGFLKSAIVDQHFISRSRYNRILSALADHPGKMGIGIEESTAIFVQGKTAVVHGENQVVVFSSPDSVKYQFLKVGMRNIKLDILLTGETFKLP